MKSSSGVGGLFALVTVLLIGLIGTSAFLYRKSRKREAGNSEPDVITVNAELIED